MWLIWTSNILLRIRTKSFTVLIFSILLSGICLAATPTKKELRQEDRQWSVMFYHGNTATQSLAKLLRFQYTTAGEELYSGELAYALAASNPMTRFFNFFFINRIQLAGNVAERHDYKGPDIGDKWVTEFDLYIMGRITRFPWSHYLVTTLAAGEGISYDTHRIYVENGITANSSPRFLNFLTLEITLALPEYPYLELVGRLHHRSGCWGLYYPYNQHPGSNNVGIGIRYYFH